MPHLLRNASLLFPLFLAACAGDTPATSTNPASATAPADTPQEKRTREIIADMHKISDILTTVNDETTATASLPAITAVNKHMLALEAAQKKDNFNPDPNDPKFVQLALELDSVGTQIETQLAALREKNPKAADILKNAIEKMDAAPTTAP